MKMQKKVIFCGFLPIVLLINLFKHLENVNRMI